jgi:hypothetical protein
LALCRTRKKRRQELSQSGRLTAYRQNSSVHLLLIAPVTSPQIMPT